MKKIFLPLYSIFLLAFLFFSYFFVEPNIPVLGGLYSILPNIDRQIRSYIYIVLILIFFIFYGIFMMLMVSKKIDKKDVFFLITVTFGILLFSYPAMLSYDIFNYIASSRVTFLYHENPYIIMPIDFTRDSMLPFMHAANKVALYGPIWISITSIPYILGFGNFILTLFIFKLFNILLYFLTILVIWKLTKNLFSIYLFALNPLVIIEILVSAHNDISMMLFAILSLFFLFKKRLFFAILFLSLSILIKYATLFLVPIYIFYIYKIIRNKKINKTNTIYFSAISMYAIFFLSPVREEIYPWYAIWFFIFSSLIPQKKYFLIFSITMTFGLLFRYVPFMFLGTYEYPTPFIKAGVTFIPLLFVFFYLVIKQKLWQKISYQLQS